MFFPTVAIGMCVTVGETTHSWRTFIRKAVRPAWWTGARDRRRCPVWFWPGPRAGRLDLVADQEIVDQEAHPAEGQDGDGEEHLEEGLEFVVLEDVEHAPDSGDDAGDPNDSCNHTCIN